MSPWWFEAYSFSEREAEEQAERERLRKQWLRVQEQIKSKYNYDLKVASIIVNEISESFFLCIADEALQITYSYWDGAGHRRVMQVFVIFKLAFFNPCESLPPTVDQFLLVDFPGSKRRHYWRVSTRCPAATCT